MEQLKRALLPRPLPLKEIIAEFCQPKKPKYVEIQEMTPSQTFLRRDRGASWSVKIDRPGHRRKMDAIAMMPRTNRPSYQRGNHSPEL
jgi:hypothetical protein